MMIKIKTNQANYELPLLFVAEHRARHYDDSLFEDEVAFVMEDPFEGLDWLRNNMDYVDFKEALVKVETEPEEEDWWNYEASIL